MVFIGIDPGGGIGVIDHNGTIIETIDIAQGISFYKLINTTYQAWLCIEQSISRPRDGHSSAFTNGRKYGEYIMALEIIKSQHPSFDYMTVHPATWKADFKLNKDKELSRKLCINIWGEDCTKYFTGARGAFQDGKAEALLLAWYGKSYFDRQLKISIASRG